MTTEIDAEGPRYPMAKRSAYWTFDEKSAETVGNLYYFAPLDRAPPPYLTQRHVEAIIDIAADGTLAGVELIDNMPPPPRATTRTSEAEPVAWRPTYAQIIDLVEACRVRRDNAGESSRMMSKWISEGLNALYTHPTTASDDQVEAVRETGWLIELRGGSPQWWSLTDTEGEGGYFTNDSTVALRFSRKQDAQACIDSVGWTEASPSEHEWSSDLAAMGSTKP